MQESVVRGDSEVGGQLPAELGLDAGTMANAGAVSRRRQECRKIEYVDDFVVQFLPISRQRGIESRPAETKRSFEATRGFRPKIWIAHEIIRKGPVEVEEGRLGHPLGV